MKNNKTKNEIRIGVYVCHCGMNIADGVEVEEVAQKASELENVVISKTYKYMCADPGQELIKKDIQEHNLNRVIVASCSPLLHEGTFRNTVKNAGLNEYLYQHVNIREQVSWVHTNKKDATIKAFALVRAAVLRVIKLEELSKRTVDVNPDVLVVGGGIAGIHAALTIASANKKVHLVEREPSIGGHMAKFDKTFPTLDCAACILTPKMTSVKDNKNINMLTYSEVTEVTGSVGNFHVKIKKKPSYVHNDLCVGCGTCIDACVFKNPKFENEFEHGLSKRKPIYISFAQAVPLVAIIDEESCLQLSKGKCKQTCKTGCDRDAIDFDMKEEILEYDVGSIILSTGFEVFEPERISELGYGKYPEVYSSLEIERIVNSAGPTLGTVKMKNGEKPKSVGIVHCVGSRDRKTNAWCSRVCCMYSLKLAHLIKERTGAEVYNFYIDMRTPGKGYEEFYDKLLEEQIHLIRGKVAEVTDWAITPEEKDKLILRVEDTMIGAVRRIPVDMVVLSVGLQPKKDAKNVSKMFGISQGKEGWFLERHPKLAPVSTSTDGVFLAGCCQGPKDIPDTVAQAGAAAAEVLAMINKGVIELEPNTAHVAEEKCSGCGLCVPSCPFSAIEFNKETRKAEVQEVLCKGCGTCVGSCPTGAIDQYLFSTDEILLELEGVLGDV